jgi:protein O-GlcNAc transferase
MQTGEPVGASAGQQAASQPIGAVAVEAAFERAGSLHAQSRLDHAEQLYRAILQVCPNHVGCLYNLGILRIQQGRHDDAAVLIGELVRLRPDLALAHSALGAAYRHLGRLQQAEACCREAVRLAPDYAEAHNTLGEVLTSLGRWTEAECCCRAALRLQPNYVEAHNNLGTVLAALGRPEDAERSYREALRLKPGSVTALNNLGAVLVSLGRPEEAEACCREALRLRPGDVGVHINLGTVLLALRRPNEAETCYREALRLQPRNAQVIHNLAIALSQQEKLQQAAAFFGRVASSDPDDDDVKFGSFYLRREICDWSNYAADEAIIVDGLGNQPVRGGLFMLLAVSSTPEHRLAYARRVAATFAVPENARLPSRTLKQMERIRLGYLSASFHIHPAGALIAGVIEHHDRQRFEVIAYAFDEDDGSAMRRRLVTAFDSFVDISRISDRDSAGLIHADEIDVLIDLHGMLPDCRAKILAYRPAPVQVNYLGYPATTGADFIDYIIVDRFVVPPDQHIWLSEQPVYLPDCFLPTDDKSEIAERTPSRREYGLPAEGFVFCCFNQSFKLSPYFFEVWMRLLRAVPSSVFWLYETNPFVKANLEREAKARGVAPERLVFAPRIPGHAEHLARYRLADLFLDTLPFNAITTASDALWAGLPVLTCAGNTIIGRVAGSLLHAVGLPELVTTSLEEYEALALRLARDAQLLNRLRARLANNRRTYPLFDTARYTRNLEAAYWRMCELSKAGQPATAFSVPLSADFP